MKAFLTRLLYLTYLSPKKTNENQERARTVEWEAVKPYLKKENFLDVGCGTGFAMGLAQRDFDCTVTGIDPEPNKQGVGRNETASEPEKFIILKGFADDLPFEDNSFGIIYSSHVLEHIEDKDKALLEMKRVLKADGTLIIGMPTATMAVINLFTNYFLINHIKIISLLAGNLFNLPRFKARHILLPASHSFSYRSIYSDIAEYRVSNWNKIVSKHFTVTKIVRPALYPYPEFIQILPFIRNFYFSSSVFFICSK